MRKRSNRIVFCLNDTELSKLNKKVKKSGLSRTEFLRKLCSNVEIKEQPTLFKDVIYQLRMIGNNLHQIAVKANSLNLIDAPLYRKNFEDLQTIIGKIMEVIY